MTLTLRHRIFLTLVPLLVLLAILGGAGIVLLYRLGTSIDLILRENYDSVIAMERLNEALERIDSSFQFALAGKGDKARAQYEKNWPLYLEQLHVEQGNITIFPREEELVRQMERLTDQYQRLGDDFYHAGDNNVDRNQAYFGPAGLLDTFGDIKKVSEEILHLNQDNMKRASKEARQFALESLVWSIIGLAVAAVLAALSAWYVIHSVLRPIQAVTLAAQGISAGNLDQVVPILSADELGQLARSFNTMARFLRDYRESHLARLLRAQRTSQATIDSFPDPVLVVDSQGQVEMANPAARRIPGVSVKSTDQAPLVPWQPPAALSQPLSAALRDQQPFLPEGFDRAISLRIENQEHFFLPRILPIRDPYGHTLGAAVLLADVTRYRLLDEMKSDLVATASHELKTPLTSVRLALHLLLEEAVGPLLPKQVELLVDARDNAERLLARVNNLLDLTRLERGRLQLDFRPEQPAALLQAAANTIRPRAEAKDVSLVVEFADDLPPVGVDGQRFGLALDNLLENAVVYTDPGGKITLSAAQAADSVVLTIADTGIGIAAEHVPHVFERFFRVPGQSRGSGTGLGLAISREIVSAHGGAITCESKLGAGTTFRLTLPVWTGASTEKTEPVLETAAR